MPSVSHCHPRAPGDVLTAGVDVGTGSVKAVAVDGAGRVVARSRVAHRIVVPSPGRLEHEATRAWLDGPRQALDALGVAPAAVAVSALTPCVAAVDASGRPCSAGLLYDDERSRPAGGVDAADPTRSTEAMELLRWVAGAVPGAAGYWPAQAVANRGLGGPGAVDIATAFASGPLFDGEGWDRSMCAACGADASQLPSVRVFGEALAEVPLAGGGRALLGVGAVDALCEQLVAGEIGDGDALVVCGSTLVVWGATTGSPQHAGVWTLPRLEQGRSFVGGASNAGGLWLQWVDTVVRPADPDGADMSRVPVWSPYPRGERVPLHDPARRAALSGVDLTQGPAELRRGALEASAFAARLILERGGFSPSRIVATGGGSASDPWMRALADVTGAVVEPVAVPEGAALGAAWLARLAAGLEGDLGGAGRWAATRSSFEPDAGRTRLADERYQRFRRIALAEEER